MRRRISRPSVWTVIVVLIGIASGVCLAAPHWTSPIVPYLTAGGAAAGLGVATTVGHLRVDRWLGPTAAWGGFVVGMVPPLSDDDALWIAAAMFLGLIAAAYVVLVNLVVIAVRRRAVRGM